ncbi:MAG: hypothetical protein HN368_05530 [Spirochaetales bacterium]|jgi:hypothetical protein|nr:hypothetical protein [Spirochaetales bacterium]
MAAIAELLENELKAAFEVKNEQSLHNYVVILVERMIDRGEYIEDRGSLKSDIRSITDTMREGFKRMDERFAAVVRRFEAVDKRFEDLIGQMNSRFEGVDKRFEDLLGQMNSRFNMMFFFMSAGFTILTVLLTLYRFIG